MGKEAGVDLKGVGAGGCIWPKYIVWNSERIKILFFKKNKRITTNCLSFADPSRYEVAGVRGGNHSFPSKNDKGESFQCSKSLFHLPLRTVDNLKVAYIYLFATKMIHLLSFSKRICLH